MSEPKIEITYILAEIVCFQKFHDFHLKATVFINTTFICVFNLHFVSFDDDYKKMTLWVNYDMRLKKNKQ